MWIKVVKSGKNLSIFYLVCLISVSVSVLNFVFLITCLSTTSLNLFKCTETVFNLAISQPSTFFFKLFKLIGTLTNLSMSGLSISAFNEQNFFNS